MTEDMVQKVKTKKLREDVHAEQHLVCFHSVVNQ